MTWESPFFTSKEMACKHTGIEKMDIEFMSRLTELRSAYGKPMVVTSGYRHPTHPAEAKKSVSGAHSTGKAADIAVNRGDAWELLHLAMAMGFTGIGVHQKGSGRFIHLDMCTPADGLIRPTIWSY